MPPSRFVRKYRRLPSPLSSSSIRKNLNRDFSLSIDTGRKEEPWLDPKEELLTRWKNSCSRAAETHRRHAVRCRLYHRLAGLPTIILPLVMTPVSSILRQQWWISYLEATAFMMTGTSTALVQFFDFSGRMQAHSSFSSRYSDIVTDIEQELAKPRAHRQQVDTFSLRIKMWYDSLNQTAPEL